MSQLSEVEQTVDKIAIIAKGSLILEADMQKLKNEHQEKLEDFLITKMSGGLK